MASGFRSIQTTPFIQKQSKKIILKLKQYLVRKNLFHTIRISSNRWSDSRPPQHLIPTNNLSVRNNPEVIFIHICIEVSALWYNPLVEEPKE